MKLHEKGIISDETKWWRFWFVDEKDILGRVNEEIDDEIDNLESDEGE